MNKEIWKNIKNYEGLYQISNLGRVKSLERKVKHSRANIGYYIKKEKILKNNILDSGYYYICFCENNIKKHFRLSRVIASTFILNPLNKPEVNHKDGDKSNNRADNLEWVTGEENKRHAVENGLVARGERNWNAKLREKDVKLIRIIGNYLSQKELTELFKVAQVTISDILNRKTWRYV